MHRGCLVKIDTALYPISTQRNLAVASENISMLLNPGFYRRSKTWPVFLVFLDLRSKYVLVGRPTQTYLDPQAKVLNIFSGLDLSDPLTMLPCD